MIRKQNYLTFLYLDCEWADNLGDDLVSLALVGDDGRRFYAEASPLPTAPTEFARHVVYPLLEHGWYAMQAPDITRGLRRFLAGVPGPSVIYDHPADGVLFHRALARDDPRAEMWPCPEVETRLIQRGAVSGHLERYFAAYPAAAARRHHAMVDAEALAWACREAEICGLPP